MPQPTPESIQHLRRLVAQDPRNAAHHNDLALALADCEQFGEAEHEYRAALLLMPAAWSIYNNLAVLYRRQRRYSDARAALDKASQLGSDASQVHFNRAQLFSDLGEAEAAIAACDQSNRLRPNHVPTLLIKARALFQAGRLQEAFELYDARFRDGRVPYPRFAQPAWSGQNPAGKRILVVAEQGAGDTIQFVRYLPMLQQRGAEVILLCQVELRSLLAESVPGVTVVSEWQSDQPFDFHIPILTLARHFGTTLDSIPANVPYLKGSEDRTRKWHDRFESEKGLKVGLVWAGSPTHTNDRYRSMKLTQFAPLAQIEGVKFFSLQKGPPAAQLAARPSEMQITDLSPELNDYHDTAAALESLDLLITVDTSPAHLAGALARPTWTLLPFEVDWRWMLHRTDSPWYPTMKLFRQPTPGDWASVLNGVSIALRERAAAKARSGNAS